MSVEDNKNNKDESLRFEMLLSEISTAFINVPYNQIDREIKDSLERFVTFLRFDRGSIFQRSDSAWERTHSWAVDDFKLSRPYITDNDIPWAIEEVIERKNIFQFSNIDDLPEDAVKERNFFSKYGPLSLVAVPMFAGGKMIGFLGLGALSQERSLKKSLIDRISLVGTIFANAILRKQTESSLQNALSEVKNLKDQLQAECGYLRDEIELNFRHKEIIGKSKALKKVLSQIEQVAITGSTVLLAGETGTGKELLARAIHNLSPRMKRAMIKVNCAALPPNLIESELFGREKGAYTGADSKQPGRFEVANGSTLFLDEISELPLALQAKLLRVLQEGQFERIGSSKTISVDVRIIAATNKNLAKAVQEGAFREDLYYRLNVFPIKITPLRERPEDISILAWAFVREFERTLDKKIKRISKNEMDTLQKYLWPGNVRELRNVIERSMILCTGTSLMFDIPENGNRLSDRPHPLTMREMEKRHIQKALKIAGWRVRGKQGAAELLDLNPCTLDSRIKKLGVLRRPPSDIS